MRGWQGGCLDRGANVDLQLRLKQSLLDELSRCVLEARIEAVLASSDIATAIPVNGVPLMKLSRGAK